MPSERARLASRHLYQLRGIAGRKKERKGERPMAELMRTRGRLELIGARERRTGEREGERERERGEGREDTAAA